MPFKAGDCVVHPTYGVSSVVRLEERQLAEVTPRLYYVLSAEKSTIWVPVATSDHIGLRYLTPKRDLEKHRALLSGRPTALSKDHRDRRLTIVERLKQGSFEGICEVVRDLSALAWRKPLSDADAALYHQAHDNLCHEWAASGHMSIEAAVTEVDGLLARARQTYMA